jgi:Domain of unknown function (DUF5916)
MTRRAAFLPTLLLFSICYTAQASSLFSGRYEQDTVPAQNKKQPVYTTTRLSTAKPVIDGKLNDECWKTGSWGDHFHQWIPVEGAEPTYQTEFNIQYDDKNLYVAMRGFDGEPGKINRMSGVRDEQVGDMMGVNFDSYRDYRTGFEFTMTAWGQKSDLVLFNPINWDFNWNPVWKGKTGLEDSAWVVEMEIPLSQLRYSGQDEQVWGMHLWRWISRLQEESDWEYQSKTGPGMLYNFGELKGINGLKKSRRLELMPFVLGELKTMKEETGNPFTKNGRVWGGNAGLDAKIGVSSNFTIDLTVNPDFGQVESDPSVMNLTAFETFYEEKRPFFLEGLTIFNYDFDDRNLFYSRRIGHSPSRIVDPNDSLFVSSPDKTTILSALKFSGTTSKGLSLGLIQSITADEYAKLSDKYDNRSKTRVEPLTNYMVARVQKGYNAGNTIIGGMLTSANRFFDEKNLDFLSSEAYTGGLDILHHWKDKEFYLDAKLLGSYVGGSKTAITALQESSARYFQRPGADYVDYDTSRTSLSGFGGKLKIGKGAKGLWKYSADISWLSPGLELNDLGYMNSADEIQETNEVSYLVTKPVSIFNTLEVALEQFNSWNFGGTWLGSGGHLSFHSTFKNNWSFEQNLIFHSQADDPRKLRGGPDMILPYSIMTFGNVMTDPSKKLMFLLSYGYESSGNNSARSGQLNPSISVRPLNSLRIRLTANYLKNYDELQYITTRDYVGEKRYILGTIDQTTLGLTLRVDLNLTPEFSVQYYGSPFVSRGTYSEYKRITDPQAKKYNDRFTVFDNPIFNSGNIVGLDENNDSAADYYMFRPDFNFHQYRSNLVAKWEYRLGSFIYLVWSSERTGSSVLSKASLGESYGQMRDVFPNNIFLIKLSYWFSP